MGDEIETKKEPVIVFRGGGVKDCGSIRVPSKQPCYKNPVIWKTIEYNIGNAYNYKTGKFTAPIAGIYLFNSMAQSHGSSAAHIDFYVNGSYKTYSYREKHGEWDTVMLTSHFKLAKGDTVWVRFHGTFWDPPEVEITYFEGNLLHQL